MIIAKSWWRKVCPCECWYVCQISYNVRCLLPCILQDFYLGIPHLTSARGWDTVLENLTGHLEKLSQTWKGAQQRKKHIECKDVEVLPADGDSATNHKHTAQWNNETKGVVTLLSLKVRKENLSSVVRNWIRTWLGPGFRKARFLCFPFLPS